MTPATPPPPPQRPLICRQPRRRFSPGAGGCIFAEQADRPFGRARIIWTAAVDPSVLTVVAHHNAEPVFDLARQPHAVAIDRQGCEHVAIAIGQGSLRLDVVDGSLLAGPVALDLHLACLPGMGQKLRAADGLLRLAGLRRVAQARTQADRRLPRLIEALRVADGLAVGASHADIAVGLSGDARPDEWPGDGDYLRSRTRRRVALARRLLTAGPAGIMSGRV